MIGVANQAQLTANAAATHASPMDLPARRNWNACSVLAVPLRGGWGLRLSGDDHDLVIQESGDLDGGPSRPRDRLGPLPSDKPLWAPTVLGHRQPLHRTVSGPTGMQLVDRDLAVAAIVRLTRWRIIGRAGGTDGNR